MRSQACRDLVPTEIVVPGEHTPTTITIGLAIEDNPVRVTAPGLSELRSVLGPGNMVVVKNYCEVWTRWLARVEQAGS